MISVQHYYVRSTNPFVKVTIEAPVYASLVASFDYIEQSNRKILSYGWVNFPLAYTQVANLSVIAYFIFSLFSGQFLIPNEELNNQEYIWNC